VEQVRLGSRAFAKYVHKFGPPESIFVQTCYVRLATEDDSIIAKTLSKDKENFLDADTTPSG
jgi:hypothetical protein